MTLDYALLVVGGSVLALCLVPVAPLQAVGTFIVRLLYKLRLSSPVPALVRGTVSVPLLLGGWGLACAAFVFLQWYRQHIVGLTATKALQDLNSGKRWRQERDMYMFASTAAIYLALHTLGRLAFNASVTAAAAAPAAPAAPGAPAALPRPSAAPAPAAAAAAASPRVSAAAAAPSARPSTVGKDKAE